MPTGVLIRCPIDLVLAGYAAVQLQVSHQGWVAECFIDGGQETEAYRHIVTEDIAGLEPFVPGVDPIIEVPVKAPTPLDVGEDQADREVP